MAERMLAGDIKEGDSVIIDGERAGLVCRCCLGAELGWALVLGCLAAGLAMLCRARCLRWGAAVGHASGSCRPCLGMSGALFCWWHAGIGMLIVLTVSLFRAPSRSPQWTPTARSACSTATRRWCLPSPPPPVRPGWAAAGQGTWPRLKPGVRPANAAAVRRTILQSSMHHRLLTHPPTHSPTRRHRLHGVSAAMAQQRGWPALHPAPAAHFIQTAFSLGRLPGLLSPTGAARRRVPPPARARAMHTVRSARSRRLPSAL